MRVSFAQGSAAYPGRPPSLNVNHPAAVGLRMAPVAVQGGAMRDLLTNAVVAASAPAGETNALGPTVVPSGLATSSSISFPPIIAGETFTDMTISVIFQARTFTVGQGMVGESVAGPAFKIQTNNASGINVTSVGSNIFTVPAVAGHSYFVAASIRKSSNTSVAVVRSLTTGQIWALGPAAAAGSAPVAGTAYNVITYNVAGNCNLGRVACASLSARWLRQNELLKWARDPWSLWYAPLVISSSRKVTVAGAGSVWSAADAAATGMTLSNGGLTVTPQSASSWQTIRSTISQSSGKLYAELATNAAAGFQFQALGLASSAFVISDHLGTTNYSAGTWPGNINYVSPGFTSLYVHAPSIAPSVVIGIAVDFTAGSMWFSSNNVWSNSSNPTTGSLPAISFVPATVGALFLGMSFHGAGGAANGVWTLQSTAASQTYAPPSGFSAWDGAGVTTSTSRAAALMIGA